MMCAGAGPGAAKRQTYSARHLAELVGSTRQSAQIYYELWTDVPLTLERFTRFTSDLDG